MYGAEAKPAEEDGLAENFSKFSCSVRSHPLCLCLCLRLCSAQPCSQKLMRGLRQQVILLFICLSLPQFFCQPTGGPIGCFPLPPQPSRGESSTFLFHSQTTQQNNPIIYEIYYESNDCTGRIIDIAHHTLSNFTKATPPFSPLWLIDKFAPSLSLPGCEFDCCEKDCAACLSLLSK
jgi:hypothetical protein